MWPRQSRLANGCSLILHTLVSLPRVREPNRFYKPPSHVATIAPRLSVCADCARRMLQLNATPDAQQTTECLIRCERCVESSSSSGAAATHAGTCRRLPGYSVPATFGRSFTGGDTPRSALSRHSIRGRHRSHGTRVTPSRRLRGIAYIDRATTMHAATVTPGGHESRGPSTPVDSTIEERLHCPAYLRRVTTNVANTNCIRCFRVKHATAEFNASLSPRAWHIDNLNVINAVHNSEMPPSSLD